MQKKTDEPMERTAKLMITFSCILLVGLLLFAAMVRPWNSNNDPKVPVRMEEKSKNENGAAQNKSNKQHGSSDFNPVTDPPYNIILFFN